MQNYPVRTSHRGNLALPALEEILRTHFDSATTSNDDVSTSFGAISRLSVRPAGRELAVDLVMNPRVPEAVARDTIARYNRFLEEATGFTSKERAKRLRKSASAPDPGA